MSPVLALDLPQQLHGTSIFFGTAVGLVLVHGEDVHGDLMPSLEGALEHVEARPEIAACLHQDHAHPREEARHRVADLGQIDDEALAEAVVVVQIPRPNWQQRMHCRVPPDLRHVANLLHFLAGRPEGADLGQCEV